MRSIAAATLMCLAAAAAGAAGTVNVTFVEPDKFFDAANTKAEVPYNLGVLEQHLKQLGQRYLPDGQVLDISVLDVDLAGYMLPARRVAQEFRVAKGTTDWPRIKVRYSLGVNGAPVKSGEETVEDLDYIRNVTTYSSSDPLYREKVLLDGWFRARFTSAH